MGIIQKNGSIWLFFRVITYISRITPSLLKLSLPPSAGQLATCTTGKTPEDPGRVVKPFAWASSFQFAHAPDGFN